jgi:Ca2+-binding EF-hand superfamily protein
VKKVFSFTAALMLMSNAAAGGDDRDTGPVESLDSTSPVARQIVVGTQNENTMTMFKNVYYPDKLNEKIISSKHFVDKFDSNKDNKVTVDEIIERSNIRFNELNNDEVGDITVEDLNSSLKDELTADFIEVFSILDENKDGLITSGEAFNATNALINNGGANFIDSLPV